MSPASFPGPTDRPRLAVGFDPKIMGKKAAWAALITGISFFISDQSGLTAYLLQFVPPQYSLVGPVVISSLLGGLRNWLKRHAT